MSEAMATKKDTTIREFLEGDAFKDQLAKALPRHLHADRFIRIAITAMNRTPKLMQCDKASFFNSLLTLSQLGLEPDGRRAHLIPFENRKKGITECQLIVDYKGIVELISNAGDVANIHADVVCEGDVFVYDKGAILQHTIDFKQPRGKAYAAYAIIRFKDNTEKVEVMTKDEIESIRKRSRAGESGPWVTDWNEMAKKTVFRRASKWVKLSPEQRDVIELNDNEFEVDSEPVSGKPVVQPPQRKVKAAKEEVLEAETQTEEIKEEIKHFLSEEQILDLRAICTAEKKDIAELCQWYDVETPEEIKSGDFDFAIRWIKGKVK